jgi:hypothetical protein
VDWWTMTKSSSGGGWGGGGDVVPTFAGRRAAGPGFDLSARNPRPLPVGSAQRRRIRIRDAGGLGGFRCSGEGDWAGSFVPLGH